MGTGKFLVSIMIVVLCAHLCDATIMLKKFSTEELTSYSDTIIAGKVRDIQYVETDKKQIYTYVTVECDDIYKGNKQVRRFQVVQEGGKTKAYTTAVYGAPSYAVNEEVILFLETYPKEEDIKRVVALSQGKYTVVADPSTGQKYAVTDLSEIEFLNEADHAVTAKPIRIPLDEFIGSIKTAIQAEQAQEEGVFSAGSDSSRREPGKFDWITWIRKKVVVYVNQMGAYYRAHCVKPSGGTS